MALDRREFLKFGTAFAAVGAIGRNVFAAAIKEGVPPYYATMLAQVAERASARTAHSTDSFWFITDPHIPANSRQSGHLLAALAGRTPITSLLCGGDFPSAFGSEKETDQARLDWTMAHYREDWVKPCRAAGMKVYTAKGNHDLTIRHSAAAKVGYTYPLATAAAFFRETTEPGVVRNAADPTSCYYYFDHPKAKLRYIVADTTDALSSDRVDAPWAVQYGIHETQLLWLAEQAFATVPPNWRIVVMHHIPIATVVGAKGEAKLFAPFRSLLEAYQNRREVVLAGRHFDFTKASGRILVDLTGHHHSERQTYQNGILHVTEPCDAAYNDYRSGSLPWCADLPVKKRGTPFEQTFDAVHLDCARDCIGFTRMGGGADREIHLTPVELHVGETKTFANSILTDAKPTFWGCYDADKTESVPNPKSKYSHFVKYFNDYATIAADGALTAKAAGSVMVLSRLADGRKEIFPVTIRG